IDWEPYWKDKETELIHFIGKDNIVFHCIIFPIILHASGSYILPKNVPANEFLNLEGEKISTSKNWAVWLHDYLKEFPNQQDTLRYVLTSNAPETKDNDFTWDEFQSRNNNELVAIYGNFINRVVVLTNKYYDGINPEIESRLSEDEKILDQIGIMSKKIGSSIEKYKFREASQNLMQIARIGNKYLAEKEPWKLIDKDPKRVSEIINTALQITACLALVSEPFLPFTYEKLLSILNIKSLKLSWNDAFMKNELIPSGHQINKATLLFKKIEDIEIDNQRSKLLSNKKGNINLEKI
ncbi:MAG: methionine--tRNA ligase, partial [Flavobacteriaceae bacterium]